MLEWRGGVGGGLAGPPIREGGGGPPRKRGGGGGNQARTGAPAAEPPSPTRKRRAADRPHRRPGEGLDEVAHLGRLIEELEILAALRRRVNRVQVAVGVDLAPHRVVAVAAVDEQEVRPEVHPRRVLDLQSPREPFPV